MCMHGGCGLVGLQQADFLRGVNKTLKALWWDAGLIPFAQLIGTVLNFELFEGAGTVRLTGAATHTAGKKLSFEL